MRILFALPGLHRYHRGAEVAFIEIARELVALGHTVTLLGSGPIGDRTSYLFEQIHSIPRERFEAFPSVPFLRNETSYEELTFVPSLLRKYRPADYDVTLTCAYPFVNWVLRRPAFFAPRPPHVFVTQNGDWPARANSSEYRLFGCEGLVCTNPDFYERNKRQWPSALIPNGIDPDRFANAKPNRAKFGLPDQRCVVLMVSALIPSKRVEVGISAISKVKDAHLVVAGDGPLRADIDRLASEVLPNRYTRLSLPSAEMPILYKSANVFLHLSREESFGNVFLEALASGLPIVSCDSPRLRWIVGDNEFLVDSDDNIAAEVARASTFNQCAAASRLERAASFSWNSVGKMYDGFLREIVSQA